MWSWRWQPAPCSPSRHTCPGRAHQRESTSASPSTVEAGQTQSFATRSRDTDGNPADVTVSSKPQAQLRADGMQPAAGTMPAAPATFTLAADADDGQATITVKAVDRHGRTRPERRMSPWSAQQLTAAAADDAGTADRAVDLRQGGQPGTARRFDGALRPAQDSAGKQRDDQHQRRRQLPVHRRTENPIVAGRIDIGASAKLPDSSRELNANAGQAVTGRADHPRRSPPRPARAPARRPRVGGADARTPSRKSSATRRSPRRQPHRPGARRPMRTPAASAPGC